MLAARATQAARLLDRARKQSQPIQKLPEECKPANLAEGYAIQAQLIHLRASPVVGWKVGCISKQAQVRAGTTEPFSGPIFADDIYNSGCVISEESCIIRSLQAEFVFRLGQDLPPHEAPFTEGRLRKAVAGVRAALEVADSRFVDWTLAGAANLVADAGKAGLLVLGKRELPYSGIDLVDQDVVLHVNGDEVASGKGGNVMGDPLRSLAWLANSMATRGLALSQGQLVSSGTCTGSYPAAPGDQVVATYGALGRVEIYFEG